VYVGTVNICGLVYGRQAGRDGVGYVVGRPMRHTISPERVVPQSHSRGMGISGSTPDLDDDG
jgi:hypothetical protein